MEPKAARQFKWTATIVGAAVLLFTLYSLRWQGVLAAIQMVVCVLLVTTILLQSGKGGGLAALGGMSDQSVFGARSNAALRNVTYFLLGMFMLGTLLLVKLPRVAVTPAPVQDFPSTEAPVAAGDQADAAPSDQTPDKSDNAK